jgi:hypothetical protein
LTEDWFGLSFIYQCIKYHINASSDILIDDVRGLWIDYLEGNHNNVEKPSFPEALRIMNALTNSSIRYYIINFDECSKWNFRILGSVLKITIKALIELGFRVFPILTGLYGATITKAIELSSFGTQNITLSPLTPNHTRLLLQGLFFPSTTSSTTTTTTTTSSSSSSSSPSSKELEIDNVYLNHILWYIGGIPGHVSKLLQFVARSCDFEADTILKTSELNIIKEKLFLMDENFFHDLLKKLQSSDTFLREYKKNFQKVDSSAIDNIFSLCLTKIHNNDQLFLLNESLSAKEARDHGLFYMFDNGQLYLPPISLHSLHQLYSSRRNHVAVLINQQPTLHTRDNETLLPAVISHRIRSFQLLGMTSVRLSEVLGVDLSALDDVSLNIQQEFGNYQRVKKTVTKKNFSLEPTNGILVNMPKASFADWLWSTSSASRIILGQEKQRCVSRRRALNGETPPPLCEQDILDEFKKVVGDHQELLLGIDDNDEHRFIFLFLTDEEWVTGKESTNSTFSTLDDDSESTGIYVVDIHRQFKVYGEAVAELKRFCVADCPIDIPNASSSSNLVKLKKNRKRKFQKEEFYPEEILKTKQNKKGKINDRMKSLRSWEEKPKLL